MELLESAVKMFMEKSGGNLDADAVKDALNKVVGEGDSFDLGGLVSSLGNGGLAGALGSWLGDGENQSVSPSEMAEGIGLDKLKGFAEQLGMSDDDAAGGLAEILPNLINANSEGGSLLGSIAGKLLGR